MKRLIVIASGKGGVGKTTTTINLGAAIKKFKKDVLIIDANMSTPNVGIHLNSPEVPVNLNHILKKKAHPYEAIYEHHSGMKVLPSSLSIKELKELKIEKLKNYKEKFKELAEFVIVDCSAGLGIEATSAIDLADELILITNPEMPAITDALRTIKYAEGIKKPITGVIITRVRKNKSEVQPDVVKSMLEVPILGMIPEDSTIQESLKLKDALIYTHPKSKPARAYKEIAAKIINEQYDSDLDKPSFWERVKGVFRKG